MDTILVEIIIPACNKSFDFSLPIKRAIGDLIPEIIETVRQQGHVIPFDNEIPTLFWIDGAKALPEKATFLQMQVRDGCQLMLL